MDPKLLLSKAITLLYRESQVGRNTNSSELVKRVITSLKIDSMSTGMDGFDSGSGTLVSLKSLALRMSNNSPSHVYDKTDLLQEISIAVGTNKHLLSAVREGLEDVPYDRLDIIIKDLIKQIDFYGRTEQIKDIIRHANSTALFKSNDLNWEDFTQTLITRLEPFTSLYSDDEILDDKHVIDFNNLDSLTNKFELASKELSIEGVMRTGIQDLNDIFGDHEGLIRGENLIVSALQHNFKSGFLRTLLRGFVTYNKPFLYDENKKPLIIYLTFEDSLSNNLSWLYTSFKEHETGELSPVRGVDIKEAAQYVKGKFEVNGFHVKMHSYNGSNFTIRDYENLIIEYEKKGYEVIATITDYLNLMSKHGCNAGPHGEEVRDIVRRWCNINREKKIIGVTAHQMSTEAQKIYRLNPDNFIREIAGKNYYDGSARVGQEPEIEICIHIEKRGGSKFLSVGRGKHRKTSPVITPEDKLFFYLPFQLVGGIVDDLNSNFRTGLKSLRGIGASGDDWM